MSLMDHEGIIGDGPFTGEPEAKPGETGPDYSLERRLIAAGAARVAGIDEVGRGAWAGPVVVCAAVTDLTEPPAGLTDSKMLTARRRERIAGELRGRLPAYAIGM